MSQIVALFMGGPADGEERALPDFRDRYALMIRPAVVWDAKADSPATPQIAIYEAVFGHEAPGPVRDEQGRYRFEFTGIQ